MATVQVLPFDPRIGYPQLRDVAINSQVYRLSYEWNPRGFARLTIINRLSGDVVWNGKLTPRYCFDAKDRNGVTLFGIMAWVVTPNIAEVWVFYV